MNFILSLLDEKHSKLWTWIFMITMTLMMLTVISYNVFFIKFMNVTDLIFLMVTSVHFLASTLFFLISKKVNHWSAKVCKTKWAHDCFRFLKWVFLFQAGSYGIYVCEDVSMIAYWLGFSFDLVSCGLLFLLFYIASKGLLKSYE